MEILDPILKSITILLVVLYFILLFIIFKNDLKQKGEKAE